MEYNLAMLLCGSIWKNHYNDEFYVFWGVPRTWTRCGCGPFEGHMHWIAHHIIFGTNSIYFILFFYIVKSILCAYIFSNFFFLTFWNKFYCGYCYSCIHRFLSIYDHKLDHDACVSGLSLSYNMAYACEIIQNIYGNILFYIPMFELFYNCVRVYGKL